MTNPTESAGERSATHDDMCERIEVDIGVGTQVSPCYCDYRALEHDLSAPDEQAVACSTDPNARHGFDRNASHSEGRYVCECESTPAAEQRAEAMGRDVLSCAAFNGGIVITLPAAAFKTAAEHHPDLWNGVDDSPSVKITDQALFVKEVVRELYREEEDGSTLIHYMFDKAIYAAIENGCEGVDHGAAIASGAGESDNG